MMNKFLIVLNFFFFIEILDLEPNQFLFHLQIEQMSNHRLLKKDGIAPVATGNWGCGSSSRGDVQLKLVIQWMAARLAGLPVLVYYTSGHEKLAKVKSTLIYQIYFCFFFLFDVFVFD